MTEFNINLYSIPVEEMLVFTVNKVSPIRQKAAGVEVEAINKNKYGFAVAMRVGNM